MKKAFFSLLFIGIIILNGIGQNESFKMEQLKVPDGFNYKTIEWIEIDIEGLNFNSTKAIYKILGMDSNGRQDLMMQNFVPKDGHLKRQIKVPLHIERIVLKIETKQTYHYFEWEKQPMIKEHLNLQL